MHFKIFLQKQDVSAEMLRPHHRDLYRLFGVILPKIMCNNNEKYFNLCRILIPHFLDVVNTNLLLFIKLTNASLGDQNTVANYYYDVYNFTMVKMITPMIVMAYKDIHCTRTAYVRDDLSLITSAYPITCSSSH